MVAFMEYFFRHLFYVFDVAIVALSLGLELGFSHAVNQEVAAVIIFLRMWRLVRAGHGVLTVEGERVSELRNKVRKNAVKFAQLRSDIKEYEFELLCLEELLNLNGIRHPNFSRHSRKYHQMKDVPHYDSGEAMEPEEREMLSDWLDEAAALDQRRVNADFLHVTSSNAGGRKVAPRPVEELEAATLLGDGPGASDGSYEDFLTWKAQKKH